MRDIYSNPVRIFARCLAVRKFEQQRKLRLTKYLLVFLFLVFAAGHLFLNQSWFHYGNLVCMITIAVIFGFVNGYHEGMQDERREVGGRLVIKIDEKQGKGG